jgi:hypothetical protein
VRVIVLSDKVSVRHIHFVISGNVCKTVKRLESMSLKTNCLWQYIIIQKGGYLVNIFYISNKDYHFNTGEIGVYYINLIMTFKELFKYNANRHTM